MAYSRARGRQAAYIPALLPSTISPLAFSAPASSSLSTLVVKVTNTANKWLLNTWLAGVYPGTAPIMSFGGTAEVNIRPAAMAAFSLASTLATGTHDVSITLKTQAETRAQVVRLVTSLAAQHRANGGAWGGDPGPSSSDLTNANFQSAMWAGYAVAAGWMVWNDLAPIQQYSVLQMCLWEAQRFDGWVMPYWKNRAGTEISSGDTRSEEIQWNTMPYMLLTCMLPQDSRMSTWMTNLLRMGAAAYPKASDIGNTTIYHGATLDSQINGSQINNNGTIVNHGFIHPDYMCSGTNCMFAFFSMMTARGKPIPKVLKLNAPLIYSAMSTVNFASPPYASPGGTIYKPGSADIYYPAGTDWGPAKVTDKANWDVVASVYGFDAGLPTTASAWGNLHMQRASEMQDRGSTGAMYQTAGEDTYPSREQYVAVCASTSLIALASGPGTESNGTAAELVAAYRA